jgi:hypothetical protein
METPTPKKRTLGLAHYFMSVKKQKSEEQLTKQEDSQHHEGLQDVQEVKEEEVKTEKDDQECEQDEDFTTPRIKYSREDFVRWGKKGGRPSSGTKHTPPSLQSLFITGHRKKSLKSMLQSKREDIGMQEMVQEKRSEKRYQQRTDS